MAAALTWEPKALTCARTDREREVLFYVACGKENEDIALALGISPLTVKNHIAHLFRKLGAVNRTQLVIMGLAHGDLVFDGKRLMVIGTDEAHDYLLEQARMKRIGNGISALLACSSPDGHVELAQVEHLISLTKEKEHA